MRTESDVPGARGNADVWVVGIISTASLLLLELLLELERIMAEKEGVKDIQNRCISK